MTARFLRFAAASVKLLELEELGIPPTAQPANYGSGRFVWLVSARGYGYPNIPIDFASVFTLWDWNATLNKYELTNCLPRTTSGALDYDVAPSGVISFVDATSVIICNPAQATGLNVARMLLTVGAAPATTMTHSGQNTAAYAELGTLAANNPRCNPVGYSANLLYGFSVSTYPAANGYVQKVSSSASSRNATALRTGLPTDNTQGRVAKSMAGLGGAAPNGYVVVEVADNVGGATCRYQLVNCTGTPVAVGTQLSYAGDPSVSTFNKLLALGASKVVAFDYEGAVSRVRASLLNTNSPTAPTTLTKGAEVYFPVPPGKVAADVLFVLTKPEHVASNSWMVEGKTVVLANYYFTDSTIKQHAVLLNSTSTSSITATILTTDISGKDITAVPSNPNDGFVVSAPGGKAVVFIHKIAVGGQYEQFVYQL